jgi:hypothetical protein
VGGAGVGPRPDHGADRKRGPSDVDAASMPRSTSAAGPGTGLLASAPVGEGLAPTRGDRKGRPYGGPARAVSPSLPRDDSLRGAEDR